MTETKTAKKGTKRTRQPKKETILDLSGSEKNPRYIMIENLEGLKQSIKIFGDLSGVVYNLKTKSLICAHQRKEALKDFKPENITWEETRTVTLGFNDKRFKSREDYGWFKIAGGARFSIRRVRWDEEFEKAANLTANNPAIQGEFTETASLIAKELLETNPEAEVLNMNTILGELETELSADQDRNDKLVEDEEFIEDGGNVELRIGTLRWKLDGNIFTEWLEGIKQKVGFEPENCIKEIERRLKICS